MMAPEDCPDLLFEARWFRHRGATEHQAAKSFDSAYHCGLALYAYHQAAARYECVGLPHHAVRCRRVAARLCYLIRELVVRRRRPDAVRRSLDYGK
jgi:hypothetical protein